MNTSWKVVQIDDQPRQSLFEGVEFVRVQGQKAQFSHAWFTKGSVLPSASQPTHAHDTEEIIYVVRGALRISVGDEPAETTTLRAGEVIVIPPNVPHGGEVLEDSETFGVNSPPRADHAAAKFVAGT